MQIKLSTLRKLIYETLTRRVQEAMSDNPHLANEIKQVAEADPTGLKQRYLYWQMEELNAGYTAEQIIEIIKFYHARRNAFEAIEFYTFETLQDKIQDFLEKQKSKKRYSPSSVKGEYDQIYSSSNIVVYYPFTTQASIALGKGAKWCTAAEKSVNFFDARSSNNKFHYYIFAKGEKYAYSLDPQTNDIEIFNAKNSRISENTLQIVLGDEFDDVIYAIHNHASDVWWTPQHQEKDDYVGLLMRLAESMQNPFEVVTFPKGLEKYGIDDVVDSIISKDKFIRFQTEELANIAVLNSSKEAIQKYIEYENMNYINFFAIRAKKAIIDKLGLKAFFKIINSGDLIDALRTYVGVLSINEIQGTKAFKQLKGTERAILILSGLEFLKIAEIVTLVDLALLLGIPKQEIIEKLSTTRSIIEKNYIPDIKKVLDVNPNHVESQNELRNLQQKLYVFDVIIAKNLK